MPRAYSGSFSKLTIPIYFGLQTIYDRQVREVLTDRVYKTQTDLCLVRVGKNEIHHLRALHADCSSQCR